MKSNINVEESFDQIIRHLKRVITNPDCVSVLSDVVNEFNDYCNEELERKIESGDIVVDNRYNHYEKLKDITEEGLIQFYAAEYRMKYKDELKRRLIKDFTKFFGFWTPMANDIENVSKNTQLSLITMCKSDYSIYFKDIYRIYNNNHLTSQEYTVGEYSELQHKLVKFLNLTVNAIINTEMRKCGINNVGKYKITNNELN